MDANVALGRRLNADVLAFVLYALLLDIAIETFWSGSPLRWWVIAVVVVYLAVCGLIRWRGEAIPGAVRSLASPTASLFVVIGLLAATVWLPGGLTDGLQALGQSTSVVLSLVTGTAIAFAGVTLIRSPWVPASGKWIVGALTAYSIVACLAGIISGTSYPALFQGESFWRRLPFMLQGMMVGGLIILPVALAVQIATLVRHEAGPWRFQQVVALAMSLLMVLSGIIAPAGSPSGYIASRLNVTSSADARSVGVENVRAVAASPEDLKAASDKMNRILIAVEEADRELPKDTFDAESLVEALRRDPVAIFKWVRDETVLVPYRGILRGSTGVLMDRRGNSLDRALLLYRMLALAGQPAMIAHGALPAETADGLLRKRRPFPQIKRAPMDREALIRQYVQKFQLDEPELRAVIKAADAGYDRTARDMSTRVAEQVPAIVRLLGRPQQAVDAVDLEARGHAREALQDHWWVRWQQGAQWVDLDPTAPESEPGSSLTEAQESVSPDELAPDLRHTVTVRAVVEFWDQGGRREVPVLSQELRPSELLGEVIQFQHHPINWPEKRALDEPAQREALRANVLSNREWLPVLSIGTKNIFKASFTEAGEINENPTLGPAEKLGGATSGAISRLTESLFGPDPQVKTAAPEQSQNDILTAEWIEYEIRSPGGPAEIIRREVFDRVGPAARSTGKVPAVIGEVERLNRGFSLLGQTEILPLVCSLSIEFVLHSAAVNVLRNRDRLLALFDPVARESYTTLSEHVGRLTPGPGLPYALGLARHEWSRVREDVFVSRPNVITSHTKLISTPKGEWVQARAFDIVFNDTAVRAGGITDPFLQRLEQGIVDTNAEGLLIGGSEIGQNTAEMFSRRGASGEWIAVRSVSEPNWQRTALSGDARSRIAEDLRRGYVVIAPTKPVLVGSRSVQGWWRVNPRTGDILGIGENGHGQEFVEYAVTSFVGVLGCSLLAGSDTGITNNDILVCGLTGAAGILALGLATAEIAYMALYVLTMLAQGADRIDDKKGK